MRSVILIVFLCAFPVVSFSKTWQVPDDFQKIQEAIDTAQHGDTVLVNPGTYFEHIDFLGKTIVLQSSQGPEATMLDGQFAATVVTFAGGEGRDTLLEGFTITHGGGTRLWSGPDYDDFGGGLFLSNASPTIRNNIIVDNIAGYHTSLFGLGGGLFCYKGATPLVENNVIKNNYASNGGGIAVWHAAPEIRNNEISFNTVHYGGSGIYCGNMAASLAIQDNHLEGNTLMPGNLGGVIYLFKSKAEHVVSGNTLSDNSFMNGILLRLISNTLLVENRVVNHGEAGIRLMGASQNCIEANTIEDNAYGVMLLPYLGEGSDTNEIYHNNFLGNGESAVDTGTNHWNNSPQSGGNYWKTYGGWDRDGNGIGDLPHLFTGGGWDGYPLIHPYNGLNANLHNLSASTGGKIQFSLEAGEENAGRQYLLLVGMSGTTPSTPLPGGVVSLPLKWDELTVIGAYLINTETFQHFGGTLNQEGQGQATLVMGTNHNAAGATLHFAFTLISTWDFASNPVMVEIGP